MKHLTFPRNRCCLQHGNVLSKTCIADQFTLRQFREGCRTLQNVLEVVIVTEWCFDIVCWILHFETPISNYLGEIILLSVLTKKFYFWTPLFFGGITIAGGKKLPEIEALEMAYRAIDQGASGVDMGRNVFQSSSPSSMLQALGRIVHYGETGEKAYQMFRDLENDRDF